jgi:hypothetical protein
MKHLVSALVICSVTSALASSTLQAAPTELPAEIRRALDDRAHSFAAGETVAWDLVRTSPLTVAQGRKFLHDKLKNVELALRADVHAAFTKQPDFCYLEHYSEESVKPGTKRIMQEDCSFDGTTHFQHTANSGEAHSLSSATQAELRDVDYHDIDETYFRCFSVAMALSPKAIDKKRSTSSVILNLLEDGAQLSAVDHVMYGHRDLVRLKIDATDTLSATDMAWQILIFPIHALTPITSSYYYLDPSNDYDLVRAEYFDSNSFMVMRIECSSYAQVDPRPVRLPKSCVISSFSSDRNDAIETETITVKSFTTTPLPAESFTLHDDKPGTYILKHMATDHQEMFIIQKDGSLKRQPIKQ